MIPKKIHYCWFGRGDKPKLAEKCIASWKRYCPDYEIVEWNEDNFDLNKNEYVKYCYANKKWAYLSDYVRLAVVAEYGGIYFDTDVEVVRSFDELLKYEAFYGFENEEYVASGLGFGAIAHHKTVESMLEQYHNLEFNENGMLEFIGCPILNTKALLKLGLKQNGERQNVYGAEILPIRMLNPYENSTGKLITEENTYSIHWYAKSALDWKAKLRSKITRPFHRIFGEDCFKRFRK
ncbi:glycosyltransferase family 32 protein [Dorea sp. ICN-14282]|uniref:glycosyltransferase family 32 protein n=1 Tax=Dorea sp. ICN-14282 TaxID=3134654 RepID=UPI0030C5461D